MLAGGIAHDFNNLLGGIIGYGSARGQIPFRRRRRGPPSKPRQNAAKTSRFPPECSSGRVRPRGAARLRNDRLTRCGLPRSPSLGLLPDTLPVACHCQFPSSASHKGRGCPGTSSSSWIVDSRKTAPRPGPARSSIRRCIGHNPLRCVCSPADTGGSARWDPPR